jgi:hypothetical protein
MQNVFKQPHCGLSVSLKIMHTGDFTTMFGKQLHQMVQKLDQHMSQQ